MTRTICENGLGLVAAILQQPRDVTKKLSSRSASHQEPASARSDDDRVALCLDGHREPAMPRQQSGIERLYRMCVDGSTCRIAGEQIGHGLSDAGIEALGDDLERHF